MYNLDFANNQSCSITKLRDSLEVISSESVRAKIFQVQDYRSRESCAVLILELTLNLVFFTCHVATVDLSV